MVKPKPFNSAEVLDSPEMIAAYLTEAFSSDDPALMAMAIGAVARSQGMSAVAEKAGLSRENLYRALGGDARPEFSTVIKVLHALGIDLIARPSPGQASYDGQRRALRSVPTIFGPAARRWARRRTRSRPPALP